MGRGWSRSRPIGRGLSQGRSSVGVGVVANTLQWRLIFDRNFLGIFPVDELSGRKWQGNVDGGRKDSEGCPK